MAKTIWLDTTAEVAPFRMLIHQIRDKQALVVPESGAASVVKTPAEPPFRPTRRWMRWVAGRERDVALADHANVSWGIRS